MNGFGHRRRGEFEAFLAPFEPGRLRAREGLAMRRAVKGISVRPAAGRPFREEKEIRVF